MRLMADPESAAGQAAHDSHRIVVWESGPAASMELIKALEANSYQVDRVASGADAAQRLDAARPALLVLAEARGPAGTTARAELLSAARGLGIPLLGVFEATPHDAAADDVDDWVVRGRIADELAPRVARLLRRRDGETPPARDPAWASGPAQFLPLIVHDLRTPLNVISLSLKMIEQALPKGNPESEEDLFFADENLKQAERMLCLLSDYWRMQESDDPGAAEPFRPELFLADVIEARPTRTTSQRDAMVPIAIAIEPSCPTEATLDQGRARLALSYALGNAVASANGSGVRVAARGIPDRWIIELSVDSPPPDTVASFTLRADEFVRLCGTAAERRGMDLALVARISDLFGGTARLNVIDGQSTTIVLDWPTRLP